MAQAKARIGVDGLIVFPISPSRPGLTRLLGPNRVRIPHLPPPSTPQPAKQDSNDDNQDFSQVIYDSSRLLAGHPPAARQVALLFFFFITLKPSVE